MKRRAQATDKEGALNAEWALHPEPSLSLPEVVVHPRSRLRAASFFGKSVSDTNREESKIGVKHRFQSGAL
jgi:hypothetical protein